ncbi:Uncharacterized protein FWK35_00028796 [Aphis craccivora]|uniref:Uncharacterized protein n=1 Tax=Aphis craccivora TaxID=307492 RepID=A0A6G0Y4Z9_APHCR|nr:Uncharacterized protein FWK35_00028796 [Aphis craccivora]
MLVPVTVGYYMCLRCRHQHSFSLFISHNKFLRFLSFKYSIIREPYSLYSPLLTFLNIETLEQHSLRFELYFAYKLLTGLIECPEFLSRFSFHAPSRNSRSKDTFYLNTEL